MGDRWELENDGAVGLWEGDPMYAVARAQLMKIRGENPNTDSICVQRRSRRGRLPPQRGARCVRVATRVCSVTQLAERAAEARVTDLIPSFPVGPRDSASTSPGPRPDRGRHGS